jgi:hypothetical protein
MLSQFIHVYGLFVMSRNLKKDPLSRHSGQLHRYTITKGRLDRQIQVSFQPSKTVFS